MKRIKYLFFAVAALAAVSCAKELVETGKPDAEGCYGVYFPEDQAYSGSIDLNPTDPTDLTFTVARTVENGDITVPVTVKTSTEGIFTVDPVTFEDGQKEAEFSVHFPSAEVGKTYDCTLLLEDPQYVSSYNLNPVSIAFSVSRVKWNRVYGKMVNGVWTRTTEDDADKVEYGAWRDDIISSLFNLSSPYPVNDSLKVYERDDKPGYYRIPDVYNNYMLYLLYGKKYGIDDFVAGEDYTPGTYSYVDATDPNNIVLPSQRNGAYYSGFGDFIFGSITEKDGTYSYPGTLENGAITFPAKAFYVQMANYTGTFYGNYDGKFAFLLPGAVFTDYSLSLKIGSCAEGVIPVGFIAGADVAKVIYEIYEGKLDDGEIYEKTLALEADNEAKTVDIEKPVVQVSGLKTGVYTVIAVSYSENAATYTVQKSTSASFNYIAEGDSVPVVVSAGIGSAEKYTPQGVNTDNSVEVYVYGSELTDVKMAVVQAAQYKADASSVAASLLKSASVSDEVLKEINGTGYIDVIAGLVPGTEYVLMVYATNGYEEDIIVSETSQYTTGDPLPIYQSFDASDIADELCPATSEGFFGKYNFYAVDYYGKTGLREYISKVTVADSETPDSEVDNYGYKDEYVEISGMFSELKAEDPNFDDTMIWDYYAGVLYSLAQPVGQYGEYYPYTLYSTDSGKRYTSNSCLIGGFVQDGYLAFVANSEYASTYGLTFNGISLYAYTDANYTSGVGTLCWYEDLLLVEESKDDNGVAPKPSSAATAELHRISDEISSMKFNCVQPEKIQVREAIRNAKKSPRLYSASANVAGQRTVKVASFKAVSVEAEKSSPAKGDGSLSLKAKKF